jgi:hypothetical protein
MTPNVGYDYTAFFSYSHADDERFGHYIHRFHEQFSRILAAELSATRRGTFRNVFIDHRDLTSGDLPDMLKTTIQRSFGLFIFMGSGYLRSEWCLQELRYFARHHGGAEDILHDRVWIFELPKADDSTIAAQDDGLFSKRLDEAEANSLFTQLRHPLYDAYRPNTIAPPLVDRFGNMTPDALEMIRTCVVTLIKRYTLSTPYVLPSDDIRTNSITITVTTPDLDSTTASLRESLTSSEIPVEQLSQNDLVDLTDQELEKRFADARLIIVPVSRARVLMRATPGGHLGRQLAALRGIDPSRVLYWQPAAAELPSPEEDPRHTALLDGLVRNAQVLSPAQAAAEALSRVSQQGVEPYNTVTVLIERLDPDQGEWELIGEELFSLWEELSPKQLKAYKPTVRSVSIRKLMTQDEPIDGHAVVIFMEAESLALEAKCEAIRKNIQRWKARPSAIYPGLIASLDPPAIPEPTMTSFPVARFKKPLDDAATRVAAPRFLLDKQSRDTLARCFRRILSLDGTQWQARA